MRQESRVDCPGCSRANPAESSFCTVIAKAEGHFDQSLGMARRQEAKTFALRAATSLARLSRH